MLKGVAKVRHWWQARPSTFPPSVPYQVACICGAVAQGVRQAHFQVVTCAGCGRKVFILPASPLPPIDSHPAADRIARAPAHRVLNSWRLPLIAAGLTLVAATLIITALVYLQLHPPAASKPTTIGQHLRAGRTALSQGDFLLAARELDAAKEMHTRNPGLLSPTETREFTQWYRQASLLAGWLSESSESLEDILQDAADKFHKDGQEWQRLFDRRYRGRALVFDAEVRRDLPGPYQLGYAVFVRGRQARLDLTNLQLLKTLPLEQPQRLLFGVRLESIHLEAEGVWVVRFEPDSGVLLTDLGAAAACCSQPEDDLKDVVERQAEWLANRPSGAP